MALLQRTLGASTSANYQGQDGLAALAARVEEKVFGRAVFKVQLTASREEWRSFPSDFTLSAARVQHPGVADATLLLSYSIPVARYPFEDDTAFNRVVRAMVERGFWLRLNCSFLEGSGCWAYFEQRGMIDSDTVYRGQGETMQEAICWAALAAVEGHETTSLASTHRIISRTM
jgi:hypothetical protein